jgi:hypothetical protein
VLQAVVVWIAIHLMEERDFADLTTGQVPDRPAAGADITVDDVLTHWENRAAECSVAFLLLLWARLVFFVFEMQATEERNDWKRYCSFYPLLLCLWAVAHCPNYVVLTASEIAHWALASAAQLAFQAHYGFCRLSRFGKWQWCDRFMEKRINDMRYWCGKHMGPGMRTRMEETAANLPELVAQRDRLAGNKNARARRGYSFGQPFFHTLKWLNSSNALGRIGSTYHTMPSQNPGGVGGWTVRHEHKPGAAGAAPRTACGDTLNPDIYNLLALGRERVAPVCTGIAEERESADATLFVLGATLEDATRGDYLLWARQYSTDPQELGQKIGQQRLYGDEQVKRELELILSRQEYQDLPALQPLRQDMPTTAAGRTQRLCAVRQVLKEANPQSWPAAPTAREGCSAARGQELACEGLRHPFFARPRASL